MRLADPPEGVPRDWRKRERCGLAEEKVLLFELLLPSKARSEAYSYFLGPFCGQSYVWHHVSP